MRKLSHHFWRGCRVSRHPCFIILLILHSLILRSQNVAKSIVTPSGTIGFLQSVPSDNLKHPLIIFLHGTGERGNGTTELRMVEFFGIPSITKNGPLKSGNTSFIVLSPQLGKQYGDWPAWIIDELLKYSKTLPVDTTQTYLTGLSLGGSGVVQYALSHPGVFTAIAPVCPACLYDFQKTRSITEPTWAFVASGDEVVNPLCTTQLSGMIKNYKQTVYPGGNHGTAWTNAYADPNLYAWFLQQRKIVVGSVEPAPDPTPPLDTARRVEWVPIGGVPVLDKNNELINGTYQVELRITQGANVFRDTVSVVISDSTGRECNLLPIANAGPDQVIKLGTVPTLKGTGIDQDGKIVGYKWTKVSGPRNGALTTSTKATTTIKGSVAGIYKYRLTVTDNKAGTATDEVILTVK